MGSDAGFEGCAGYGGLISIHAPRMGIDRFGRRHRPVGGHFNPRSPDGERHPGVILKTLLDEFQSTFPGWGATYTSPLPYIDA